MHEISIVESIIDIVLNEIPKYNITRVSSIALRIGEMQLVVPEALRFGFKLMAQNTPLEGAEIIIESVPTTGRCKNCGYEFNFLLRKSKTLTKKGNNIDDWFDNCPKCEKTNIEVISGKEMEIINFEGC